MASTGCYRKQPSRVTMMSGPAPAGRNDKNEADIMQASNAYLIGHISVKDPEKWAEYCRRVPDTVAPWGASLVFRGEAAQVLDGEHSYTDTVVIRFPDRAAVDAWHQSSAYQAIVPLRKQAADVVIISYQG